MRLAKATGERIVYKVWGSERILVNTEKYCLKEMTLLAGHQCSLHKHKVKDETFIVQSGWMELELGDEKMLLTDGSSPVRVPPNTYHRFASGVECVFLEVSTQHSDTDVERIEESK